MRVDGAAARARWEDMFLGPDPGAWAIPRGPDGREGDAIIELSGCRCQPRMPPGPGGGAFMLWCARPPWRSWRRRSARSRRRGR